MKQFNIVLGGGALALLVTGSVMAGNHAEFITGPFASGPEVTKKCLECHGKQGADFMKTVHWTWSRQQTIKGKKVDLGKKNALNNFCIGLPSNWARCTSCHAGYGWKDGAFDFAKAENIDCLVCHETTGTYKKFPAGAGHPVYAGETKEFPKGKPWEPVDLVKAAQSVGKPTRAACGSCHFYGGGGDHIKHGDLDSSMTNPPPEVDVHMGRMNFTCQSCHKSKDHHFKGEALSVSVGSGARTMGCTDCHKANVHKNAALNRHAKRVACQTCHIPTFAKVLPTKTWWDWSTAGKDVKPEEIPKDKYGMKLYDKMKGDFKWEKDVVPTYFWFNGTVDRYIAGEKIDPKKVVKLNSVQGSRKDTKSKIMPFKVMRGKQAYDSGNNTIAYVNVFGPPTSETAYWVKYDWSKAIEAGMKAAGQPYSGTYGFVETEMAWSVNHMVVPKEQALKCADCHGKGGRMDWKALGYRKDPKGSRK
jgi:octaheme c-type cytochrome (tetrathionate reductase family)